LPELSTQAKHFALVLKYTGLALDSRISWYKFQDMFSLSTAQTLLALFCHPFYLQQPINLTPGKPGFSGASLSPEGLV